jgi:excisionase family DNA binding protein
MADEFSDLRYLSIAKAGSIASLSPRTIRRAIGRGELRAHKVGKLVRIEARELVRWIECGPRRAGSPTSSQRARGKSASSSASGTPVNRDGGAE